MKLDKLPHEVILVIGEYLLYECTSAHFTLVSRLNTITRQQVLQQHDDYTMDLLAATVTKTNSMNNKSKNYWQQLIEQYIPKHQLQYLIKRFKECAKQEQGAIMHAKFNCNTRLIYFKLANNCKERVMSLFKHSLFSAIADATHYHDHVQREQETSTGDKIVSFDVYNSLYLKARVPIKLVLIGSTGVGKTSILQMYTVC